MPLEASWSNLTEKIPGDNKATRNYRIGKMKRKIKALVSLKMHDPDFEKEKSKEKKRKHDLASKQSRTFEEKISIRIDVGTPSQKKNCV